VNPGERILIGANVFHNMALGRAGILQPDPLEEPADRPVLLAVDRVDSSRVCAETGRETAELEAVQVEDHVVRLDVDGVART